MKKNILLLVVFGFIAISCSDDPVSPTKGKLLPMTQGSWWTYDNYEIDTNNISTKQTEYDSVVVTDKTTLMDKEATILKTYTIEPGNTQATTTNNYYYEEDSKLYLHSKAFSDAFANQAFDIQLKEQWMKVADKTDEDWKVYEEDIDPIAGPFGTTVTGKIIITGEKGGTKNFTVNGKSIKASEFLMNINFTGTAVYQSFPITLNVDRVMKIYLADGIGMISQQMAPSEMQIPLLGNINLPGTETILTKYSIK